MSDETLRAYVGPLFAKPEAASALERWLVSFDDTSQTREIEPMLRKLTAPTLIVWGTGDPFFPLKWAYWLKGAIPGARQVVELKGRSCSSPRNGRTSSPTQSARIGGQTRMQ